MTDKLRYIDAFKLKSKDRKEKNILFNKKKKSRKISKLYSDESNNSNMGCSSESSRSSSSCSSSRKAATNILSSKCYGCVIQQRSLHTTEDVS